MENASHRAMILVHLANQVGRVAADVARITDAVYGMNDPAIRENLAQLQAVEVSLKSLARTPATAVA